MGGKVGGSPEAGRALGVEVGQRESLKHFLSLPREKSSLAALPASPLCAPVFILHTASANMQIRLGHPSRHVHTVKPILIWSGLDLPHLISRHSCCLLSTQECCYVENNKLVPVFRHFCLLFPLPGMLSPQICHGSLLLHLRVSAPRVMPSEVDHCR